MSISSQQSLYMMVGFPASGKTTIAKTYDLPILSRDVEGGSCAALLPKLEALFKEGKSVVLDNTNLTKEARAPFIALAKKYDLPVHAVYIENTIEDCQVNALVRMWRMRGRLYLSAGGGNPLPISVLFVARKNFEKPTMGEGFDKIIKPAPYNASFPGATKALFLDIDGTLRRTEHLPHKYPLKPDEVELIKPVAVLRQAIDAYRSQGYRIIGVSNQSGIAKGTLTEADAEACFERTRSLLGYTPEEFPIMYCPHRSAPITCYCRKPQSGLFVKAALEYGLDISVSIMVGDLKTDETAAQRLGIRFIHAKDFV
jgi:histidinol-phosphate phosphatase family protein